MDIDRCFRGLIYTLETIVRILEGFVVLILLGKLYINWNEQLSQDLIILLVFLILLIPLFAVLYIFWVFSMAIGLYLIGKKENKGSETVGFIRHCFTFSSE